MTDAKTSARIAQILASGTHTRADVEWLAAEVKRLHSVLAACEGCGRLMYTLCCACEPNALSETAKRAERVAEQLRVALTDQTHGYNLQCNHEKCATRLMVGRPGSTHWEAKGPCNCWRSAIAIALDDLERGQ